MNAEVNALVTTSTSFTGVPVDARERILAFLLLRKSKSVVDATWVKTVASWFQGWTLDNQLNALCFALAAQNGFPTNGPALQSIVDGGSSNIGGVVFTGWGKEAGVVNADVVTQLTNYGLLLAAQAQVTLQSTIS